VLKIIILSSYMMKMRSPMNFIIIFVMWVQIFLIGKIIGVIIVILI